MDNMKFAVRVTIVRAIVRLGQIVDKRTYT